MYFIVALSFYLKELQQFYPVFPPCATSGIAGHSVL
jgi:hypothetical protein